MPDSILVLSEQISSVDTIADLYQSPAGGQGTIITACTVANNTTSSASFKMYIYSSSGDMLQALVPMSIVVPDRFNSCPSAVNHVIPPGGSLRAENSASNSLSFTVSGRNQ